MMSSNIVGHALVPSLTGKFAKPPLGSVHARGCGPAAAPCCSRLPLAVPSPGAYRCSYVCLLLQTPCLPLGGRGSCLLGYGFTLPPLWQAGAPNAGSLRVCHACSRFWGSCAPNPSATGPGHLRFAVALAVPSGHRRGVLDRVAVACGMKSALADAHLMTVWHAHTSALVADALCSDYHDPI